MNRLDELLRATVATMVPLSPGSRDRIVRKVAQRHMARVGSISVLTIAAAALVTASVIHAMPTAASTPEPSGGVISATPTASGPSASGTSGLTVVDSWWGSCRSTPLVRYPAGDSLEFSLSVVAALDEAVEPGSVIAPTATLTSLADDHLLTSSPDWAILYDGMIVSVLKNDDVQQLNNFAAGDIATFAANLSLTRCDMDAPLPPGPYQLISSQMYASASGTPEGEGSPRVTSTPLDFTIAGTPPENPFTVTTQTDSGGTAPEYPADAITSEAFLRLLAESQTEGVWDMAEGTSRWLMPGSISYTGDGTLISANDAYFGCAQDGGQARPFPTTSSTLDLLTDHADSPDSLRLRYGWIVTDPHEFAITTTNNSDYAFTGLYAESNQFIDTGMAAYRTTYLVSNGRAVAWVGLGESHPFSTGSPPWAGGNANAGVTADQYYGVLRPGDSLIDMSVITQISPCWSASGSGRPIRPGTYTLVSQSGLWIGSPLDSSVTQVELWTSFGTIDITYE